MGECTAHFLIGGSLTALPQQDLRGVNMHRLNRYQHLQQMLQHFWVRWQREYLPQLQRRRKWTKGKNTVSPGMMVLIQEDSFLPCSGLWDASSDYIQEGTESHE
ncbi:uncharacterized protein LOC143145019 isoform X2 [Ptiloglossa arizonensis]|uniref:uncharacterized protein LOC143145019 isoform X2 n=1 Tax=Ptiloglossa arizonensis TaxID=3350558 RepID=UPI003FA0A0BD